MATPNPFTKPEERAAWERGYAAEQDGTWRQKVGAELRLSTEHAYRKGAQDGRTDWIDEGANRLWGNAS